MVLAVGKTQASVVAIAGGLLAMVALGAYGEAGPRQAVAVLIGGLAGLSLYHASFGFGRMATDRD